MNTLLKVLAGVTLVTLLVLPVAGVLAACVGTANGVIEGSEACDAGPGGLAPTATTPGCSANCEVMPATTGGTGGTGGSTVGGKDPSELPDWTADEVMELIGKIVNWIFTFLMLFVVIMVLIAGFTFVTGGGNPDNVTKARNMLMYALVGFAVGMLAKGIIALVQAFLNKEIGGGGFI